MHAVHRVLYPYFERRFIHDSYSSRVEKGTHKALGRLKVLAHQASAAHTRTCWVLKCDIKKFFASIDHEILFAILRKRCGDEKVFWLLKKIVSSFTVSKDYPCSGVGLPLGNLTSQLLVNVYMNEFDQYVKHTLKTKYYVRYADDFLFLSRNKAELEHILRYIVVKLTELKLQLHPDKVSIKTLASGVDFLGWMHFADHRVLRTSTKKRMFKKLKTNPGKDAVRQSYLGLLKHGNARTLRQKI